MPPDRSDIEDSESSAPPEDALEIQSVDALPELEILQAPLDLQSVVTPIDASAAPEAFVQLDEPSEAEPDAPAESLAPSSSMEAAAVDEEIIEELEDFEEIDDFELIDDAQAPDDSDPAAAPPPLPPRMPTPREPASEVAPPVSSAAPAIEAQLLAFEPVSVLDELLDGRKALDWKGRADKLTSELAQAEGRTRVGELAYELGELYQRYLDDEAGAVKSYGRALQADPSLRANLWAIRRIFYRRKLWPNLVKLIGAELRFASSDRQRADLHVERGRILVDELGDATGAQTSFEQATALDPENITALLALERIARGAGDKARLWSTLEALARVSGKTARKAAFLIDLARDFRISRERLDDARMILAQAAELDVLHDEVAREREALAVECEDASGLAASLERRISRLAESFGPAGLPDPAQAQAGDGSAQVLRKILGLRRHQAQVLADSGDAEGAWSCLQEALALSPEDPLLLIDLADLAERLGRYDELAELVAARESGEVDPSRALSLALRRASALAKANKQEEADELLRARANAAPGYLPLVVARELQAGAKQSWTQLAALQAELADALRFGTSFGPGADTDPEPTMAAAHYVVAGDLLRFGTNDTEAAQARYTQALEVSPGHLPALQALTSLYTSKGAFEQVSQLLELQAESGDSERRAHLLEDLCSVYQLLARGPDELAALRRLQKLRPGDLDLQRRLVELLRENAMHGELAAALADLAQTENDLQVQARMLFERGRILAERLGEPEKAAECFRSCLRTWPDDAIVQESLMQALRSSRNWQGLGDWLASEVEICTDPDALSTLARESLALAEFRIGDKAACDALALSLCERSPGDLALLLDAIACLEATPRAAEQCQPLADLYGRLVAVSDGALRTNAQLRLGTIQLGLGRVVDAEQSFGDAAADGSLPARLKLQLMAAGRGDANANADAMVVIAEGIDSAEHKASLLEQAAWQRALSLDDEGAAELFALASKTSESSQGALLGTSLLAAKLGDKLLQGETLERLARVGTGSYASSSMLLRAGMLADVAGDEPAALRRLEQARLIAPQDAGTAVVRADRLAPLAPDAQHSQEELLARAELCDMRSVLADAGPARIDWELERAEALERVGQLQEALQAVASVLDQRSDDIRALQLLRRICLRGGDRQGLARASVSLAKLIGDSQGRLQLLREAALIFDDELNEVGAAITTYRKIVEEEPGAPEYERLIALLVQHEDLRALYRCYSARLNHLDVEGDQRSRVVIFLARSRIREQIGDLLGASRDLKALLDIDSGNSEALFERARLLERFGEAKEAAGLFQRFLAIEADPERRASAELSLSHLLADSLDDVHGAIEQLEHVLRQSPRDIEIRERFVSLLLKAKQIDRAVEIIREQSNLRASDGERARDELRIATLLKEREDRGPALASLARARQFDPLNMDALRELVDLSAPDKRDRLLAGAARDIRRAIGEDPMRSSLYERLLTVGQWSENNVLIRQSLQALAVVGTVSAEQQRNLDALGVPLSRLAKPLSDESWRSGIQHHDAGGFASELWGTIGAAVAELADNTPIGLGFERGQRTKGKAVAKTFPMVAEMASFLGLEVEVYVSEARVGVARAVSAELPTICLGDKVASGKTREQRFATARAMAHAKLGSGTAAELEESELCLYFAAAAELAGVGSMPAELLERVDKDAVSAAAKRLAKVLSRRARKDLTLLASRFSELGDPMRWRRGTQLSSARLGLLLCGSLAAAFEIMDVGKGGRALSDDHVAQGLLAWSVGEEYLQLLHSLGEAGEN